MISDRSPHRPIRRDPTCREMGRPVHQNGESGGCPGTTEVPSVYVKSFHHNTLRRRAERERPARIVHSPQSCAEGRRQIRPTLIEET